MEWSKEDIKSFIELYHKKSIIWDPQDPEHFNKIKKQDAWMEIAGEVGRPMEQCRKKMENLLAPLRREKMKMRKSVGTGKGTQDVYKSNWFAFTSLEFILDKNKTKPSLNTMRLQENDNSQEEAEASVEAEELVEAEASAEAGGSAPPDEETNSVLETSLTKRSKATPLKAKVTASADGERLDHAFQLLQFTANHVNHMNQDECFYFGNFIASKLRLYDESARCAIQNDIINIFRYNVNSYSRPHPTFQPMTSPGNYPHSHPNSHNTAPVPYPSTSTSSETSHNTLAYYDSQNPSPSTPQQLPSPNDSSYSEDFNITDLI